MPKPPLRPFKQVQSEERKNLERRCALCSFCDGAGLVTVFHERYTGEPCVRLRRPDGQSKAYPLRIVVTCVCPLGDWMGFSRETDDATAPRISSIRLIDVIEGTVPWSVNDPTLPYHDPSEVPDWRAFREMLARGESAIKRVFPEPSGNRKAAYREMGEDPDEAARAALRSRRAVVPDDYGPAPKKQALSCDDDSDIPF